VNEILKERNIYQNNFLSNLQKEGVTRYKELVNNDSAVVDYI